MSQKGRATLKEYFEAGKMPTEEEFGDLIDSGINKTDDQITVKTQGVSSDEVKYIGIGSVDPQAPLSIRAHGATEKLVSFESPEGQESWQISQKSGDQTGLNVGESGVMDSQLFIQSGTGNVGIGTSDPKARLHVEGSLKLKIGETINEITEHIEQTPDNYRTSVIPTEKALRQYVEAYVQEQIMDKINERFVGSITAFALDTTIDGWLECNGQAIKRDEYRRLFEIIGVRFGAGNGVDTFNLPDLRGEFIRGWDAGKGVDPVRDFGSYQYDQLQSHKHIDGGHSHSDAGHSHFAIYLGNNTGRGPDDWGAMHSDPHGGHWATKYTGTGYANIRNGNAQLGNPVNSGTGVPRHGKETRPRNMALMYCIKY